MDVNFDIVYWLDIVHHHQYTSGQRQGSSTIRTRAFKKWLLLSHSNLIVYKWGAPCNVTGDIFHFYGDHSFERKYEKVSPLYRHSGNGYPSIWVGVGAAIRSSNKINLNFILIVPLLQYNITILSCCWPNTMSPLILDTCVRISWPHLLHAVVEAIKIPFLPI